MNIAICDRYDTDITRISEFLDANIKKHMLNHALLEVDTFTSTDELLASPKEYSLIFLGILMPGTDGIEAARQLKDGPNPPIIIFTTKSTEHCLASYNLGVEGYILKPIREEDPDKVTGSHCLSVHRILCIHRIYLLDSLLQSLPAELHLHKCWLILLLLLP